MLVPVRLPVQKHIAYQHLKEPTCMKYLFINSVYGFGSTGRIIADTCKRLSNEGHMCAVAYGRTCVDKDCVAQLIRIGRKSDYLIHAGMTRLFDLNGYGSILATKRLISKIENYRPDVIWLHNLHGYYLNIEILFNWLKEHPRIKILWTLHDCWAFTGHCAHFSAAGCNRWLSGCGGCTQLREYPKTYGQDRTRQHYAHKQACFSGVSDLTILVPSEWLAQLVRQSFLKDYPVEILHNQIDTSLFKPTASDFKKRYGLSEKAMILGVASVWDKNKGLPDFCQLRKKLDDHFAIVLVGVTAKQKSKLPPDIIALPRTTSPIELAELYTAADIFVNPTHQDNYPTVNLEARACGTPVITYDVGGSPESAGGKYIVKENDIDGIAEQIYKLTESRLAEKSV